MTYDFLAVLKESGGKEEADINLAEVALAFAAPSHPGISIDKYQNHLAKLSRDVGARHAELIEAGAADNAQTQLAALKHIIADREAYIGDEDTYNHLDNADLMRVIDRRKGLPIALSILYIHAGRENGWEMDGLNFPGHFLCRIQKDGLRIIFDAFQGCRIMDAAAMRALLKKVHGEQAELSPDYYNPSTNREILVRLENNVKLRLIEAEEYKAALETVERMRLMAPGEYRLLLDAGVLYVKTGRNPEARDVLLRYIAQSPNPHDRRDAEMILWEIEGKSP